MFGLMIRKIPKEAKVPKWIQRSDYWNTKTWSIELGTIDIGQWCYSGLYHIFKDNCARTEGQGYEEYFYFDKPSKLLKLTQVFYWKNVLWAVYMLKKYGCEVYVYEADI